MEKSHCASQEMENVINALYLKKKKSIVAATALKLNWSITSKLSDCITFMSNKDSTLLQV